MIRVRDVETSPCRGTIRAPGGRTSGFASTIRVRG
jgi:hypothetical protein